MAEWGIQTWDSNGVPNNTGIVRIMTLGHIYLPAGQVSGRWGYNAPSGFHVQAIQSPITGDTFSSSRRKINWSGGTLFLTDANGDYSENTITADEAWLIVYLVKN